MPTQSPATSDSSVKTIGQLIAVAASVQTVLVYLSNSNLREAIAPALIAVSSWVMLFLLRRGHKALVPPLLVSLVLLSTVIATLAFGSVRTSASVLFVAAVAGAGIFLTLRALVLTVVLGVTTVGVLTWAELHGWIGAVNFRVGLTVWLTHAVTMVVVAVMVFYSRTTTQKALEQANAELQRRIRSEHERDMSVDRFAKAFNFSPLNMTITRMSDGVIIEVSRNDESVQGHRPEELVGKTSLDIGSWQTPEDRANFVAALKRKGRVSNYETRMRHRNGTLVDARMWAVQIDIDGEPCILSCTINATKEKRREALLLGVAQGMTGETGQAFFDALTRHAALTLNADVVVVGELQSEQEIQTLSVWRDGEPGPNFSYNHAGTPCSDTLARVNLCVFESGLSLAFPGETPLTGVKAEAYVGQSLREPDGSTVGVLKAMWRQPITLSAEMQALMSIFSGRATAELIRLRREREIQQLNATLEQRVRERTAELETLNAELDSFAYSVSHDLKSPLRAIDGFTQLLGEQLEGRLQPAETQLFERVLASTRRMSGLIADLLALARVSQGPVELTRTNLSELAVQVMQVERAKLPQRRLQWQIEPGLVCVCDPRLMRIALENLLGNAVKYTRDQPEPLIEIGRVPAESGEPLTFFVRDNGVGFDMAYADKLFKPFQRLHMPSEFDGTGIGLATVRRIVERHGGNVNGSAKTGQGAEFRVTMGPARPPSSSIKGLR